MKGKLKKFIYLWILVQYFIQNGRITGHIFRFEKKNCAYKPFETIQCIVKGSDREKK